MSIARAGRLALTECSFNCQMGRGRTTTGMVAASLIATIRAGKTDVEDKDDSDDWNDTTGMDLAEETQYLNGELPAIGQT
jgi:hypothetical protein